MPQRLYLLLFTLPLLFAQKGATQPTAPTQGLAAFAPLLTGLGLSAPSRTMLNYTGQWAPDSTAPPIQQHRINFTHPLKKTEKESWSTSAQISSLHFERRLSLGTQGPLLAHDFYRNEIGFQYSKDLDHHRSLGVRGNFGSASDRPFEENEDLSFSFSGSYIFPSENENFWVVTMFISNNSPLGNYVPIPGFVYLYKTPKFVGMFGLPIASFQWMPIERWSFSFALLGPQLSSEIAYSFLFPRQQIFFSANWGQQSFLRADRSRQDDRLVFDEKRIYLGARSPLSRFLSGELQIGQAFARSVFEGDGFFNRDRGSVDLEDSWFLQVNLRAIF
ncbi:MAG: hypothetical protein AB7N80_13290 [Bdellovibrionales bacterium]